MRAKVVRIFHKPRNRYGASNRRTSPIRSGKLVKVGEVLEAGIVFAVQARLLHVRSTGSREMPPDARADLSYESNRCVRAFVTNTDT